MNLVKWVSGCALIWVIVVCTSARGQFGDPAETAPAKPESKPGEVATEKSLLSEHPNQSAKAQDTSEGVCECVGETESEAVEKIEQALRGPLHSTGFEFVDTPLSDVVSALQDDYGIPIKMDHKALEEIGIGSDEPVTINLHNISLRSALRLMLKQLQLTYVIKDEVLLITTAQEAESQLKICVYDVRALSNDGDDKMVGSLIDTLLSCVATETWAKNGGGEAEVRSIKPGLLVISQTSAVHEEIRSLLDAVRKLRQARGPAANSAATSSPGKSEKVVTHSYLLQLNPAEDINALRGQVRDLIVQTLPDETWSGQLDDGQSVVLTVFHDRVVVRHKPSVQEKVQKLLAESGVATPASATAAGMIGAQQLPGRFGPPGFGGGLGGRGFDGVPAEGPLGGESPAEPLQPQPANPE